MTPGSELLRAPIRVGSLELRNRIVHVAINTGMLRAHEVTPQAASYWRRRAGGVAAIVSGLVPVHATSVYKDSVLRNVSDEDLPALAAFADAVAGGGAVPIVQLVHNGGQMPTSSGARPWSPSGLPVPGLTTATRAMESGDVRELIAAFVAATDRCRRAGIPAVEIHVAHGFLLHQFLSPLTNQRSDEYGTGGAGRHTIVMEVLDAIRSSGGERMVVGVRLSMGDATPGGLTEDFSLQVARQLSEEELVDYVSISVGNYATLDRAITPYPGWPAPLLDVGRRTRAQVDVPVVLANGISTGDLALEAIASGATDIVGAGRPLIADPDWASLVSEEHPARPVRPCIGCNECFAGGGVTTSEAISCAVNPRLGDATDTAVTRRDRGRARTLVIGAGVAGLTTAVALADRGHYVRIVERDRRPGGQVFRYDEAVTGGAFGRYVTYALDTLARAGITVECGVDAGSAELQSWLDDPSSIVVIATGSRPAPPRGGARFTTSWELVARPPTQGVVLIDGSNDRGPESLHLAYLASSRGAAVTLLTPDAGPGADVEQLLRRSLAARLPPSVTILAGFQLAEMDATAADVRNTAGESRRLEPLSTVVTVDDRVPVRLREPSGDHHRVHHVGDCVQPRNLSAAIRDAYAVADMIVTGGRWPT